MTPSSINSLTPTGSVVNQHLWVIDRVMTGRLISELLASVASECFTRVATTRDGASAGEIGALACCGALQEQLRWSERFFPCWVPKVWFEECLSIGWNHTKYDTKISLRVEIVNSMKFYITIILVI